VDNAVVLSTIHQAKGLEWKYVFIVGLRDGDFPHHKSLEDAKQLEEERRLFYVAATRARDELTMLYPVRKMTYQYGEMTGGPSMFIRELDDSLYAVVRTGQYFQLDDEQKNDDGEEIVYLDF
jgi:DNA helicase-2/ATP-dependent DNA helicase PcrA